MHTGIIEWGKSVLTAEVVSGKRVLEVGSLDVNGSLQSHITSLSPSEFIGADIKDGPGVDMVLDAKDLVSAFGPKRWDVVLCTEMLEHCPGWHEAVYQMKASLAIGGWLFVTTRSPGYPKHDYPGDHWRFTPQVMLSALADLEEVEVATDPGWITWVSGREVREIGLGVLAKGRRYSDEVLLPTAEATPVNDSSTTGAELCPTCGVGLIVGGYDE